MVGGSQLVLVLVPLEHREVHDPGELEALGVAEAQVLAQLGAHGAERLAGDLALGVRDHEDEVAGLGARGPRSVRPRAPGTPSPAKNFEAPPSRAGFLRRSAVRRSAPAPSWHLHPGHALGAVDLGRGLELLDLLARIVGLAGHDEGLDAAARRRRPWQAASFGRAVARRP